MADYVADSQSQEENDTSVLAGSSAPGSSQQFSSSSGSATAGSSGSYSSSQQTLPVASEPEELADETDEDEDEVGGSWKWGELIPLQSCYEKISLTMKRYYIGRAEGYNIFTLKRSSFDSLIQFQNHSHKHCEIYINNDDKVFIRDLSSNGTFVNGKGQGTTQALISGDTISFATSSNKAYRFLNVKENGKEKKELPKELRIKYRMFSEEVGGGATARVRLGKEHSTGKEVAIKVITKRMLNTGESDETKHEYEVTVMKSLDHPCITKVFDVYRTSTTIYIVMEFVNGGELFDRVKKSFDAKKRISEKLCKFWVFQIVMVLKYLHSNNITHRDIKLENILLTTKSERCLLKVIDFGSSRWARQQSQMKTKGIGTLNYMAPEILEKDSGYTNMCDLWSLGVLVFTCLNGHHPFTGQNALQRIKEGRCKVGKFSAKLSSEADDLIKKLLVVNPDNRLTLDGILKHPWIASEKSSLEEEVSKLVEEYRSTNVPIAPKRSKKSKKVCLPEEKAATSTSGQKRKDLEIDSEDEFTYKKPKYL